MQNVFETDRLITWGLTGGFDDLNLYQIQRGLVGKYGVTNDTKYLLEYYPIDRETDHFIIPDGENISHVVLPSERARLFFRLKYDANFMIITMQPEHQSETLLLNLKAAHFDKWGRGK